MNRVQFSQLERRDKPPRTPMQQKLDRTPALAASLDLPIRFIHLRDHEESEKPDLADCDPGLHRVVE